MSGSLAGLDGFSVGHWTDSENGTGCTVVLCPQGAIAGVDVRGGAPGTREIALLNPLCMVEQVHAVVLGGGSAFGLAAADGVMRWLEERDYGYDTGAAKVPIVPAAILFDLPLGNPTIRPDAQSGYAACESATSVAIDEGSVGAGTGATVGKVMGFHLATKGGLGIASQTIGQQGDGDGIVVAAIVAVNALGDVVDPQSGNIVAGARHPESNEFVGSQSVLEAAVDKLDNELGGSNTTLGVVMTNAALTKQGATKVAMMAHNGFARTIRPVHTMLDGDTIFAMSRGERSVDPSIIGAVAADVMAEAVLNAVRHATALHGIPAAHDLS